MVKIGDKDLFDGLYIRTTGLVPSECIGGPILDHDGNAVALVFNQERGLAIGYDLKNLQKLESQKETWRIVKVWERIRESIMERINKY